MKSRVRFMLAICIVSILVGRAHAAEPLTSVQKIIPARSGEIPQAPRVSPDGRQIVFEYYAKNKTTLWSAGSDGANAACLTCGLGMSLENGFWHPSGAYLVFNEVPEGNARTKGIYTAAIKDGKLDPPVQIATGARPQFSRPNGHVIFFETAEAVNGRMSNILAYKILGSDPRKPSENMKLELRGPIQLLNQSAEISHPSLAPDGTTIAFAARTVNLEASGGYEGGLVMNDTDRQKVYKLWKALIPVDRKKIDKALARSFTANEFTPAIGNRAELTLDDYQRMLSGKSAYAAAPTIVPGYSEWHLLLAWVLGLLDKLDTRYDGEVQEMIFPRLWTTDVFGAPITPLVKDLSSAPLPQKWPTLSHDGKFAVFEAGLYTDRHIYLVAKKGDRWMDRAVRVTEAGSYNSSPEIDPSGEWLYFESNRDGSKGIWRARLNWPEIDKKLGR